MYANDTVLFLFIVCNGSSVDEVKDKSSCVLQRINEGCERNKIVLNVKKCKHLLSGPRKFSKEKCCNISCREML